MDRVCVSAVRCGNIVIYRNDLPSLELKKFIAAHKLYEECPCTPRGNIFYDGKIFLQEWDRYKVKSLDASFAPDDFHKTGEYGSDDFGTLQFKNCVGIARFKDIRLNVESDKISKEEMERLMGVVNTYIVNLSYDFNQSTFSSIRRNRKKQTDIDYHKYLLIHHALASNEPEGGIFQYMKRIENNPCRTFASKAVYEDISLVREINEDALMDIFTGSTVFVQCGSKGCRLAQKLSDGKRRYLPKEVYCEDTIDSFDNPENRFVKYFLQCCLQVVERFDDLFCGMEDFRNDELKAENREHIKKLNYLLTQGFLKNVGEMRSIPMYSTVLTKRDGYRQLYSLFLGLKSMPEIDNHSEKIKELLENKSLDVLYENYCYFGLSEMIASIYGQKLNKKKYRIYRTPYAKTLEKKTDSNYFEFERTDSLPLIRVHYNKNYVKESYSKPFAPDISIEIYDASDKMRAMYVFDAKFKADIYEADSGEGGREERRKYKYDDINKMHTYRDALKMVCGAFILYPGTEDKIFYIDEDGRHRELLYGVGAFRLGPGKSEDFHQIREYVEKMLQRYGASE